MLLPTYIIEVSLGEINCMNKLNQYRYYGNKY